MVVGAGVSGLAAAHRLAERAARLKQPVEVLLLEASERAGGVVCTERREGFLLEGGPDAFITEKPEALELARRVGLGERLIETNRVHRRSFVVRGGRLRPTPEGFQLLAPSRLWPFVTSDIFSLRGKARMALDLLLPRGESARNEGDSDESLAAFVRRRLGQEALERMAQPMVGGIYTADPELLSLRATMPCFLEMERRHRSLIWAMWRAGRRGHGRVGDRGQRPPVLNAAGGAASGARYNLFLSFDAGMQTLTDRLAELLPAGCLRLNTRVTSVSFDARAGRWELRVRAAEASPGAESEVFAADSLCLALPARQSAKLLRATDPTLADELGAIAHASTATVNLAYRRADIPHPLDGFGFVVPHAERRRLIACSFSSVKFANRAPAGHALLRAFVGGALQPEAFALDNAEMVGAVRRDLRDLLGVERPPLFAHVTRWPDSMPQYHLGHLERAGRIRARLARLPSLQLAGNAYTGAGIPDCVRSGEAAADSLLLNGGR